jgi:hypothetical protein
MLFLSLSVSDTKWWLVTSEILLIVSTVVLVVGLVGEWSDSEIWQKRIWYKLAKSFVIIGVIGELFGDAGIFETSGRLDALREADNLALAKIANDARDKAAKSELALERFKAPRSLNWDQRKQISDAVKSFGAQEYVTSITMGPDTIKIRDDIEVALDAAGWVRRPPLGQVTLGDPPNASSIAMVVGDGVRIQISPDQVAPESSQFRAATALADALQSAGIAAKATKSQELTNQPNLIQIMIGYKPSE